MATSVDRSQMVKGLVDLAILTVLAHGESYGYEIQTWFEKAGLTDVGHASLYGGLKRLEKARFVSSKTRPSPMGPPRKYYSVTGHGETQRQAMRASWTQLHQALTTLEEGTE